jgi:excinuclease UvrABC ATPase subunit
LSRQEIISLPVIKREKFEDMSNLATQAFYKEIGVESILGYEEVRHIMYIDQSSIGKTPRSCPATFIGLFDDIRKLYA